MVKGLKALTLFKRNSELLPKQLEKNLFASVEKFDSTVPLHQNVILNPNDGNLQSLEICPHYIRFEYSTPQCEEYQHFVRLYDEWSRRKFKEKSGWDEYEWMIPMKLRNNTSIGAGCTVWLSREKFLMYLKKRYNRNRGLID